MTQPQPDGPCVSGWIVQPLSDEPDWFRLCKRVMELVQGTRNPQWVTFNIVKKSNKIVNSLFCLIANDSVFNRKIETSDDYLKEYINCQYYDEKAEMQDKNEGRMSELGASVCSTPLTLRATPLYPPVQRKFHYNFKDGSSFILYLDFYFFFY